MIFNRYLKTHCVVQSRQVRCKFQRAIGECYTGREIRFIVRIVRNNHTLLYCMQEFRIVIIQTNKGNLQLHTAT
jgi:hypothetical protein